MKKSILSIAILTTIISIGLLSSCSVNCIQGSGKQITERRKADDFKKIEISGAFKVHLIQDSSSVISIKADDNIIKYVSTSVEGGELTIRTKKDICNSGDIVINIGVRKLDEINASGAVELYSDGKLNTGDLNLQLSGSTRVTLDVNAANVSTNGSGATELNLSGQAAAHNIQLSGSGKLSAFDFVVSDYNIETSGASHCDINVLKTLTVKTSGSSEIQYKGSPSTINNDKSSVSSIKKVD